MASAGSDGILDGLGKAINAALVQAVAELGTAWARLGTPDLMSFGGSPAVTAGAAAPASDNVVTVLGWLAWGSLVAAALSLIVLGANIARSRHSGQGGEWTTRLVIVLFAAGVITSAAAIVKFFIPAAPSAGTGTVSFIQTATWYVTVVLAVISVVIGGAKMALQQRAQPGKQSIQGIVTLVVVSAVGVLVVSKLSDAVEGFSRWILDTSMACDATVNGDCFARNMGLLLPSLLTPGQTDMSAFWFAVLSLCAAAVTALQMGILVVRLGVLVVMMGLLPMAAALSGTDQGRTMLRKYLSWLTAWLLYKPIAVIIYAAAFQLAGTQAQTAQADPNGLLAVVTGLMLLLVAIVALPVLIKFLVPVMASMGSGDGAGAGLAAAVALPTGAVSLGLEAAKLSGKSGGGAPPSGAGRPEAPGPSASGSSGPGGGPQAPPAPRSSREGTSPSPGGTTSAGSSAGSSTVGAGASAAGSGGGATAGAAGGPVGMAVGAAVGQGVAAATSVVHSVAQGASSAASSETASSDPSSGPAPTGSSSTSGKDLPDGSG